MPTSNIYIYQLKYLNKLTKQEGFLTQKDFDCSICFSYF